ncbi:hypothetical protein GW17_00033149 [Ensete ventricosum]|nr:hypothetical protein GW17_00033149 [Ensete ventricosum]
MVKNSFFIPETYTDTLAACIWSITLVKAKISNVLLVLQDLNEDECMDDPNNPDLCQCSKEMDHLYVDQDSRDGAV